MLYIYTINCYLALSQYFYIFITNMKDKVGLNSRGGSGKGEARKTQKILQNLRQYGKVKDHGNWSEEPQIQDLTDHLV